MTIDIQCITPANASLLAAVAEDVFDEDITPDRLGAFLAAEGHVMFVAVEAGQVVGQIRGMVHVQPDRASDLYVDNLGVAPSHKRRQIGSQLIAALMAWGEARGCTYVWLATEPDNDQGLGFYGALNFERSQLEWLSKAIGDSGKA